jgi:NAD+ diphosphatase
MGCFASPALHRPAEVGILHSYKEADMRYPEAVNLPFNTHSLADGFRMAHAHEAIPAGDPVWLILQGGNLVVCHDGVRFVLPAGDIPLDGKYRAGAICIGTWHGRPLMALSLSREGTLPEGWLAEPFNAGQERLDDATLTLGGMARQILSWRRLSARCSVCGGDNDGIAGTWGVRCRGCGHEHFPHIHPCVIVLVRDRDRCLLVRKPEWPEGRYSLVAGFVDFGESLEECVRREVREETGVEVANIRYVGSQNWPFPSQLMAGFVADYAGGEVAVDVEELADARWFHAADPPRSQPGGRSIARWILERYSPGLVA